MNNRIFSGIFILAISIGLLFINSCEKDTFSPYGYEDTVEELYATMNKYYFWKDSISEVDYNDYYSPDELLEAMRFEPRDHWSYITTKDENSQYYDEGTYVGYGFGYSPDSNDKLRITYLYESSVFNDYDYGIHRGWLINKINGVSVDKDSDLSDLLGSDDVGVSNNFEFESPVGDTISGTFSKKLISINTVVYKDVIISGSKRIGCFVFQSFIGPSKDELTNLFNDFNSESINELVIDLRYNGGGMISIVEHLASLIIPDNLNGQKFLRYVHNSDNSELNENIYFKVNSNSLKLDKVYFITSKGSASASEAIINGLDPYLDVYIVGNDTYGKPVGMYPIESTISNLIYVPVCFKLVNAVDYGGYYEGLKADSYVDDDVANNFGIDEAVFSEVLFHIENGYFSSTKSSYDIIKRPVKRIRSIKDERGSL